MSVCLGHNTVVRQQYKRPSVSLITSRHCNDITERLLTVMLNLNSNKIVLGEKDFKSNMSVQTGVSML